MLKEKYFNPLRLDLKLNFGVEIELDDLYLDDLKVMMDKFNSYKFSNSKNWNCDTDASVPYGAEIISSILTDTPDVWTDFFLLEKILKKENVEVSDRCAFHVHFNADYYEKGNNTWTDFLEYYMLYEPLIYYFSFNKKYKGRDSIKEYARPLNFEDKKFLALINFYRKHNVNLLDGVELYEEMIDYSIREGRLPFMSISKYHGLNIGNCLYRKEVASKDEIERKEAKPTIEFRCADGTYDPLEIKTLVNFYGRLLEKSKNKEIDTEKLRYLRTIKVNNGFDYQDWNSYKISNQGEAEVMFSFVANNPLEEKMYMKQYLKK